jgi:hypothetical protein
MVCNLIEINSQDILTQIMIEIEYVLEYLNKDENEAIEKELENKYKEEISNLKENNIILLSNCFDQMKI